jgi:hypothetical protein
VTARVGFTAWLVAVLVLGSARIAAACPVCFGDPNAQMSKGAEQGVWFLLGVMFLVQIGFGIFFLYLRRRLRDVRDPMPRPVFRLVKG